MNWILTRKMKFTKNQKGLTLVELLAVIVILGVIAAIAVPSIGGVISSSKTKADAQTEQLLKDTAERYMTDTDPNHTTTTTSVTLATLKTNGYLKSDSLSKQSASVATVYTSIAVSYASATGWTAGAITTTP